MSPVDRGDLDELRRDLERALDEARREGDAAMREASGLADDREREAREARAELLAQVEGLRREVRGLAAGPRPPATTPPAPSSFKEAIGLVALIPTDTATATARSIAAEQALERTRRAVEQDLVILRRRLEARGVSVDDASAVAACFRRLLSMVADG